MRPVRLLMVAAVAILAADLLEAEGPSAVILAGTPASVEKGICTRKTVCRDFDVYGDGRTTTAMISTMGLGRATLRAGRCDVGANSSATLLRIPVGTAATPVCICIPADAFPGKGTVTGKIVATAAATTVEAAVSLSGTESVLGRFFAALLWGLGFAVPALFSMYLGQRVYLWQKRKDREQQVLQARVERIRNDPEAEKTFFENFLPQLAGLDDKQFTGNISDQFGSLDRLFSSEDAVALKAALDAGNRAEVLAILSRNFPNRKKVIDSLRAKE